MGAFVLCASLRGIQLNEGLEHIENKAFSDSGLERVRIPNSVSRIGNQLGVVIIPKDLMGGNRDILFKGSHNMMVVHEFEK